MIHVHLTYNFIKFWNISEIGLPLFSIEFSMTFTCWPVWLGKVPRPLLRSRPSGSCHWWWQSYHSHFLQPTSQTSCSLWVYSKGRSFAVNTKIKLICIIGINCSHFKDIHIQQHKNLFVARQKKKKKEEKRISNYTKTNASTCTRISLIKGLILGLLLLNSTCCIFRVTHHWKTSVCLLYLCWHSVHKCLWGNPHGCTAAVGRQDVGPAYKLVGSLVHRINWPHRVVKNLSHKTGAKLFLLSDTNNGENQEFTFCPLIVL